MIYCYGQLGHVKCICRGSSARKLKRGQANLLAGRAVSYYLYPLSYFEMGSRFSIEKYLQWGGLPKLLSLSLKKEKILFLESYTQNYLKDEILQEQIIRNIQPFRNFLELAGQMNGQIINYSKFAREDTFKTDKKAKNQVNSITNRHAFSRLFPQFPALYR